MSSMARGSSGAVTVSRLCAVQSGTARTGHGDGVDSAIISLLAGVAQLVEQRIRNAKVEGSTPSTGTLRMPRRMLAIMPSALMVAVVALAFAGSAQGEVAGVARAQTADAGAIYRCRQANGAITYQDYPCKGGVTVEIKPDAADPAAIERLRHAQAEFDRAFAQRQAAEAMDAFRRDELARDRAAAAPGYNEAPAPPPATDLSDYLLYGPIPPTRLERRDRRPVRPIAVPERRVPAVIRRPRAS